MEDWFGQRPRQESSFIAAHDRALPLPTLRRPAWGSLDIDPAVALPLK
jgi:hypothetical protein